MKQLLIISVEHSTNNPNKPYVKDFVKQVVVDSSLSIPYSQLADCIRFIFGSGSIIGFKLMEYGKD